MPSSIGRRGALLVELVGPEAGILAAEVEKLAVYVGESRRNRAGHRQDGRSRPSRDNLEDAGRRHDRPGRGRARASSTTCSAAASDASTLLAAMSATLLKIHHAGRLAGPGCLSTRRAGSPAFPRFAVEKTANSNTRISARAASIGYLREAAQGRPRPQGGELARPPRRPRVAPRRPATAPTDGIFEAALFCF